MGLIFISFWKIINSFRRLANSLFQSLGELLHFPKRAFCVSLHCFCVGYLLRFPFGNFLKRSSTVSLVDNSTPRVYFQGLNKTVTNTQRCTCSHGPLGTTLFLARKYPAGGRRTRFSLGIVLNPPASIKEESKQLFFLLFFSNKFESSGTSA